MKESRILLAAAILAGTAVLIGLGTWQVQRLHWKELLIAQIADRRAQAPETLEQIEQRWYESGDVDYFPILLTGHYLHAAEQFFYTTLDGRVGWNVYTPLEVGDGEAVMVNRGFVPVELREPGSRPQGQMEGEIELLGLARNPVAAKPNRFVPDNEPQNATFFWRELGAMAVSAGLDGTTVVPFFVDAGPAANPGGWPKGGVTLVNLPNNHLQYAITWFGLALALLGVGGYYMFETRRNDGT
jgi:surfeit locus 1 family protein